MNKYLARLKAASPTEKPSIPPSVTSGTEGPGSFQKTRGACGTFGTAPGGPAEKHASGEFWPWAPYLGAADVQRMQTELLGMIERLADLEEWPDEQRDDVLARAVRGPLADLLPNLHHFNQRLTEATAAAAAREAVEKRTWRFDR
ncbi:hypothetical protein [Paraburkholderia tropica]|uniref:hypothetical protein n=1 Tax=Paraburkholderia tropica TaxID=92647 RepID=UPI002AB7A686|nr:hypothetical protein [Paraburkholderia tropica]